MARSPSGGHGVLALIAALVFFLVLLPAGAKDPGAGKTAVLLEIKGPIGPATSDYIGRGLEKARERGAQVVILRVDTPGGLDTSMREIIQDMLTSPLPVIVYVAPGGARAASAGTYILYASTVAAMAPGTNLGAATPVQIGGAPPPAPDKERGEDKGRKENGEKGEDSGKTESKPAKPAPHPTMTDKVLNDAVAYIRSLAQMRGRNAEWAEKAVTEAASLAAEEALKAGVIDLVAGDLKELLEKVDGRKVTVLNQETELHTAGADIVAMEPAWRNKLLAAITNPNLAYIRLLICLHGLLIEFANLGFVAPGVIGAISLFLGLFALHLLPINFAGAGLILLGLAFMVAEAFVPAFGALGIGGVVAFVIGSLLLLDTDLPGYCVSWQVIAAIVGTTRAFSAVDETVAVGSAVFRLMGDAVRVRVLGRDRRGVGEDIGIWLRPVVRHLSAAGRGVGFLGEHAKENVFGAHPERDIEGNVPVVGKGPVLFRVEGIGRPHLSGLVARSRYDEANPALPV